MSAGLALFDLDGTLVDSAPDIAVALDRALRDAGRTELGLEQVRQYIGDGAGTLVHRALTHPHLGCAEPALFASVYRAFLAAYDEQLFTRSRVYPGVSETLQDLRQGGWRLACITNKPARFSTTLLAAAGLARYFELVVSGDSLPRKKPHPAPLLHAAQALGGDPGRTVMIGDSAIDLEAARRAGVVAVAVSYGYARGVDLAGQGAAAVIDAMDELPAHLGRLFA